MFLKTKIEGDGCCLIVHWYFRWRNVICIYLKFWNCVKNLCQVTNFRCRNLLEMLLFFLCRNSTIKVWLLTISSGSHLECAIFKFFPLVKQLFDWTYIHESIFFQLRLLLKKLYVCLYLLILHKWLLKMFAASPSLQLLWHISNSNEMPIATSY